MLLVIGSGLMAGTACRNQVCAPLTAGCNAPIISATNNTRPLYYTCPMHPSVKVAQPGACPICGMNLVAAYREVQTGSSAPCAAACCALPASTNHP
jgi:hypothetical protein